MYAFLYDTIFIYKLIEYSRQKTSGPLSSILGSISGLPKCWITNSRPCSPRVLFYFETCPETLKDTGENSSSIKMLEHSLEDQIYHVLKENHIVHNIR